jgi:hypothetical protein
MYYVQAEVDKKNQPKIYPLYLIKLTETQYKAITKKVIDKLVEASIERMKTEPTIEDSETDSETESLDTSS